MNKYEVMFIINPVLDDAAKEAAVNSVKEIIAAEGEVTKEDVWGMKKLAYPIKKATKPEEMDTELFRQQFFSIIFGLLVGLGLYKLLCTASVLVPMYYFDGRRYSDSIFGINNRYFRCY